MVPGRLRDDEDVLESQEGSRVRKMGIQQLGKEQCLPHLAFVEGRLVGEVQQEEGEEIPESRGQEVGCDCRLREAALAWDMVLVVPSFPKVVGEHSRQTWAVEQKVH